MRYYEELSHPILQPILQATVTSILRITIFIKIQEKIVNKP